jgi:hypothetical protein
MGERARKRRQARLDTRPRPPTLAINTLFPDLDLDLFASLLCPLSFSTYSPTFIHSTLCHSFAAPACTPFPVLHHPYLLKTTHYPYYPPFSDLNPP